MIQFGTGKVDFAGVFATLKAAGFDGPIMVECCKIGAHAGGDRCQRQGQPRVPRNHVREGLTPPYYLGLTRSITA